MRDVCRTADLIHNRVFAGMLAVTVALLAAPAFWPEGSRYWSLALLTAWGVFCSVNAFQCGRIHCRITGPLCLLGALTLLMMSWGVVTLSGGVLNAILLGGVAGAFVLEAVLGKYGRAGTN